MPIFYCPLSRDRFASLGKFIKKTFPRYPNNIFLMFIDSQVKICKHLLSFFKFLQLLISPLSIFLLSFSLLSPWRSSAARLGMARLGWEWRGLSSVRPG